MAKKLTKPEKWIEPEKVTSPAVPPAPKTLTKPQIVAELAARVGCMKKLARIFLATLAELACEQAEAGFTVPGLGKLVVVHRPAGRGRNPRTGKTIKLKARKVIKFRVSKSAKRVILGKK